MARRLTRSVDRCTNTNIRTNTNTQIQTHKLKYPDTQILRQSEEPELGPLIRPVYFFHWVRLIVLLIDRIID